MNRHGICISVLSENGIIEITYKLILSGPRHKNIGPLVLYRSPECIGYAELEQAWIYTTIRCINFPAMQKH